MRALATRIQDEGEGAKAIGILGSDPYDALLILKALRPAFPHAIFFTVDLDARHLHASEYKWTRNMVMRLAVRLAVGRWFATRCPAVPEQLIKRPPTLPCSGR